MSIKLGQSTQASYRFVFFKIVKAGNGSYVGKMIENDKSRLNAKIESLSIKDGVITTKPLRIGEKVDIEFD